MTKRTTPRKPTKWDGISGSKTDPFKILTKKLSQAGFTHPTVTTEGLQFWLFVNNALTMELELKERRDGTYLVKPTLPQWIIKEIEAAGYQTKPEKHAAPQRHALRLVEAT